MDGTLFDTVPANQAAYAVALAPYGVSLSVEDFALHCNGRYYRDFLGELLGGDEAKIDAVHDAKLAAYPALFHRIRENTALFSLLQTLRADYHTALVTSATRCSVEAILRYFHRENCFDLLLTNVEVPHKKPAPDSFLMAMEHFGVAPPTRSSSRTPPRAFGPRRPAARRICSCARSVKKSGPLTRIFDDSIRS